MMQLKKGQLTKLDTFLFLQEVIDSTGTETRQILSRMSVTAKISKSCLPLLEIE